MTLFRFSGRSKHSDNFIRIFFFLFYPCSYQIVGPVCIFLREISIIYFGGVIWGSRWAQLMLFFYIITIIHWLEVWVVYSFCLGFSLYFVVVDAGWSVLDLIFSKGKSIFRSSLKNQEWNLSMFVILWFYCF